VEIREIPLERDRLGLTPEQVLAHVDEKHDRRRADVRRHVHLPVRTVAEIAAALDKLQAETGLDIPIHVDGRIGRLHRAVRASRARLGLRIPRVHSINASGHKFGLAPLGVGWIVWREKPTCPKA